MKTARTYRLGIAIAVVALLAFVSFLLTTNYLSQKNLQQTLLDQFRLENETRAAAISYFFSDRHEDLRNLASSREIAVFFENRALGMSMEYGLKQSRSASFAVISLPASWIQGHICSHFHR